MISKAEADQIIPPIGNQILRYRPSLYADDAVIFLRPDISDLNAIVSILSLFGDATGLCTNLGKRSILPIACSNLDLAFAVNATSCQLSQFPCVYLGMPLSDKRPKRDDFQRLLDKFMKKLACWKAKWISMACHLTLITSVLSALPAYQLMAIIHPKWLLK